MHAGYMCTFLLGCPPTKNKVILQVLSNVLHRVSFYGVPSEYFSFHSLDSSEMFMDARMHSAGATVEDQLNTKLYLSIVGSNRPQF